MRRHFHCSHTWRFGYALCCRCGLLYLRNPATDAALRAACPGREDD